MAGEDESLLFKLEADLQSFRTEMLSAQKIMAQSSQGIEKSLEEMAKNSEGSFSFLKNAAASALGFIGSQAILKGLEMAKDAVLELFKSGIQEAAQQEEAVQKLNSALAQSGHFSTQASAGFQSFAEEMQKTTRFSDDAIISAGSLIQSLARLDQNGLQGATKAAANLSTALGIDLESAARLVGKALTGEVGALSRYGIAVQEGSTKAETLSNVLKALETNFGGSSQNAVKTYSGSVDQLKNAYADVEKQAGALITSNPIVIAAIGAISQAFQDASEYIAANKADIQAFIADGVLLAIDALTFLNATITQTAKGLGYVSVGWKILTNDIQGAVNLTEKLATLDDGQDKRADALYRAKNAVEAMSQATVKGANDISPAQEKINAGLERQSQLAAINNEATQALSDQETTRLNAQIDNGKKMIEDRENQNTDYLAILERRNQAELDANEKARQKGLINETTYQQRNKEIDAKYQKEKTELTEAEEQKRNAIRVKGAEVAANILGSAATVAKAFGKEGFEAYKKLAGAQAIISAFAAAQNAFAATNAIPVIGPFLAPVQYGLTLAAGFAQAAQIQAQTYAKGGEVPGIGFGDTQPSLLTPGETVIDRSTTSKLKKSLSGDNEMIGEIRALRADIQALFSAFPSVFQVTNIDGKAFFELINGEIRSGRRLVTQGAV